MLDPSSHLNSSRLLQLAIAGDGASLETLMSLYVGYLNVLARAHFDQRLRRRLTATDVVQDTLMEAHQGFAKFSGTTTAEFTGWLRIILVHNMARQIETHVLAAKRDVRRERHFGELSESVNQTSMRMSSLMVDERRSPSSEADHQESLVELGNAIERLSPEHREVIVLRHLEGRPFPEIAEQLKRSPGATRMLWLRAIERLRSEMK